MSIPGLIQKYIFFQNLCRHCINIAPNPVLQHLQTTDLSVPKMTRENTKKCLHLKFNTDEYLRVNAFKVRF